MKGQLLRKYRGYLGSLKQEFTKKRKKGKLPKEARQQLLEWWSRHYKWPYPSVCCIYNMILKPIYNCLVNFMNLSSIGDIYRSITIMVKDYFGIHFYLKVFFFPIEIKEKYHGLIITYSRTLDLFRSLYLSTELDLIIYLTLYLS